MISNLTDEMIFELYKLPSSCDICFFFKFEVKTIFFYDFVGLLFPLLKFSCCMVLMTELFLKALNLVAMNISHSFFDSNENRLYLSLITILFCHYLLQVYFQKIEKRTDEIRANPLNNDFQSN